MAQVAAVGAARVGDNYTKAVEKYRKYLGLQKHVYAPRKSVQVEFAAAVWRGLRQELRTTFRDDIGEAKRIYRHLRRARGPFSTLVVDHSVAAPTAAQRALLALSERLDTLGAAFAPALESEDLEKVKDLLLTADGLDGAYWTVPEEDLPDADVNRERLRGANSWDQLTTACAPFVLNTTLSWLGLLDIATLSEGRLQGADFSLFQPLITQPTENSSCAPARDADRQRLPVANLIRLVKEIRYDTNARLQKRAKRPKPKNIDKESRAKLANDLKPFKKNALLSDVQFTQLMTKLRPDDQPNDDERCGFDIGSLHVATNLFSLLTPRDGLAPMRKAHRIAPDHVTCLTAIEPVFMRWWATHREELTEGANPPPRPRWLTALRAETGHPDLGHRGDPPNHPAAHPTRATPNRRHCSG